MLVSVAEYAAVGHSLHHEGEASVLLSHLCVLGASKWPNTTQPITILPEQNYDYTGTQLFNEDQPT